MRTEIDLAYTAGLFDGEGYFGVRFENHPEVRMKIRIAPIVTLGQNSQDFDSIYHYMTERFPDIFFGKPYHIRATNVKVLRIKRKDEVMQFIRLIKPFVLLPSTKKKIDLLEKIYEIAPKYKKVNKAEFKQLLLLVKELRTMSKRSGRTMKTKTDIDALIASL